TRRRVAGGGAGSPQLVPSRRCSGSQPTATSPICSRFADLHNAIQAADPAGQTTLSTHVLAFRQELALVEVVTRDTGVSQIYRQQRAFRRTEEGWQEVEAVGAVRGAWQTLETSYFTLSYQSGDAEA